MIKKINNRFSAFLRYFVFYSVFIFFIMFNLSRNSLLNMLPNLSIVMIFYKFIWFDNKKIIYIAINLFILGLIIDAYSFLPLFLSSFSLLLSYKIMTTLRKFLFVDSHLIYLLRDSSIFITLFFIIRWFIYSYYNENFYDIFHIIYCIINNIIYSIIIYIFFNKFLKNV